MFEKQKLYVYTIVCLGLLLIGMYVWRMITVKNMEAQRARLVQRSQQVVTSKTVDLLRLATIPLVWAVRKEMLRDNYDQINDYLTRFIKEPHIKQILVVKSDGSVAVATDKKVEGTAFSSLFPQLSMEQNEISVTVDERENLRVVAPIMGLNAQLGLLILIYEPETIHMEATP